MSYHLLASVSEDAINYISEAVIEDRNGKPLRLKDRDGKPNIKSCMHVLGFNTRFGYSIVLSSEKKIEDRVPKVLVRHATKPSHCQEVKLYAGKMRENYEPHESLYLWLKNISFDDNILHVDNDRECFKVEDFGNEVW